MLSPATPHSYAHNVFEIATAFNLAFNHKTSKINLVKMYLLLLLVNMNIGGAEMFTEFECRYRSNGDVKFCSNITQLDTRHLTRSVTMYTEDDGGRNYSDVSVADLRGYYQWCEYGWYDGKLPDICVHAVAVPADTKYVWCQYYTLHSRPSYCTTYPSSRLCLIIQPYTNMLLHQIIPPVVYITGILFNILITLVLYFKADKSVLNFLLLMLSVWDVLYLGCLVVESVIGHCTHENQIQISDISYAWLDMRCDLGDSSACDVRDQWYMADINIAITTLNYPLMYWLHVTALVFQIASIYQTIVIATFRCIAIRRPFQASQLLTFTTAAVSTGGCLLLGVIVHVPDFIAGEKVNAFGNCYMKYIIDSKYDYYDSTEYHECVSNISAAHNPMYSASSSNFINLNHYYHIITYSIILFLALPFMLLMVLNILMLAELYRGSGVSHDDENKAVTKVVAAIVTVFLVTYLVKPLYIIDIFYFSGHIMNSIAFQSCGGYFTMSLLITVMPALNSVINLPLYLGLRQTFRDQFTSMFLFCKQEVNTRRYEAIALQPIHR